MSEQEMSQVDGREGIAMIMDGWRVTSGDAHLNFFEDSFFGDPDFSDEHVSVGKLRINSPGNWDYSGVPISAECDPFDSFGCNTDPGIVFGTLNDPFQVNVTEYNPNDSNEGILAFRWPDQRDHMERVNASLDLHMNANASSVGYSFSGSNTYLGTANIVNSLWSGGTQLELSVVPDGGVDVGLDIELDGDAWLRTRQFADGDAGGAYADGIFGASSFTGTVDPSNGSTNCCDSSQFSGALTWASLEGDRPLWVRFNNDQIEIRRVQRNNAPSGTIGINELNMGGSTLGTTVANDVVFDYLRIRGPN